MDSYTDIERMRREIMLLHEKLEHQTVITEEHIRRSMKDKLSTVKRHTAVLSLAGLLGAAFCYRILHHIVGLSFALGAVTALFLLAAVAFTIFSTWRIRPSDVMGENLALAGKEIIRMKKLKKRWKQFAFPFVVLWFIWVVVETLDAGLDSDLMHGFLSGCGFGLLGGGICGAIHDRQQNAMLDELLRQIDELGE